MTQVVKQKLAVYNIRIHSLDGQHVLELKVNRLDRPVLTTLPNPGIGNDRNFCDDKIVSSVYVVRVSLSPLQKNLSHTI